MKEKEYREIIWANCDDLSRPHPKSWFERSEPQIGLVAGSEFENIEIM